MIEDNSKTFDKGQTNQTSYEAETLDAIRNQMSTPLRVVPDIDDLTIRTIIKLRAHFYSSLEPRYPEVHSLESFAEKTAIMLVIKESCEKYIKQYFSALYKEFANHSIEDNWNPHSWLCTHAHIPTCPELQRALDRQSESERFQTRDLMRDDLPWLDNDTPISLAANLGSKENIEYIKLRNAEDRARDYRKFMDEKYYKTTNPDWRYAGGPF